MPNLSFQCWTGVLKCDAPGHPIHDPDKPHYPDWYYDAAKTAGEYKRMARLDGWLFKRDGRVICGECAKRSNGEAAS